MKFAIGLSVLLVGFSIFYYLVIFLPQNQRQLEQNLNLGTVETIKENSSQAGSQSKSWTLFTYSSVNPDQDFLKNRIENINSQEACIQAGVPYATKGGSYECAYGCKYIKEYKSEICERTCDHKGCRE